ncbi:Uncharacterised protein [Vibrio cholerae]|uniref:Uncharacterized protein n=1 Tax=Vibrio cholerae TaxID=666 RepID=A0A656A0J7_VIBCL|nr:Uncharacterised protein [Vibrio cholerae]CSC90961.1 Uncharacterised protein [Vibrio cholerae]CSD04176.1 Uncharacterised protein [Vibrio cholerae]CSI90797.1 Uncharacterised protein [Vibrio cholerae]
MNGKLVNHDQRKPTHGQIRHQRELFEAVDKSNFHQNANKRERPDHYHQTNRQWCTQTDQ